MLFSEPATPRTTSLGWDEPKVHWFTESSHPQADMSRAVVNSWYDDFSDSDGQFARRIRSEDDIDHSQALDELVVHHLLRTLHRDVRYEEGGVGPDFRVYDQGRCVLAVEVATLFMRQDWRDDHRRHDRLADEINKRVPPTDGYFIDYHIEAAPSEPAPGHFADWLRSELAKLPPHTDLVGVSYEDIPAATYERKGVRILVRFIPMKADAATKSNPDGRIVGMGKMTVGFVNSASRLRDSIGKKGGDRYDIRGVPFVVVVGNRDNFLSDDVVLDGLYGGEAVMFDRRDHSKYEVIRRNDGLFSVDTTLGRRRHTRISAVAILGAVVPWEPVSIPLAIYDNLAPETPLPDEFLPATHRFGKVNAVGDFSWRY